MASSPPYSATSPTTSFSAGSPPAPAPLSLPKKRPSLGGPTPSSSAKRRKPSTAGPSHLRQTSFPPEGAPSFTARSPSSTIGGTPQYSRSPSVDTTSLGGGVTPSLLSAAPSGKKRGRKSKAQLAAEAAAEGRSGIGDQRSQRGRHRAADEDADDAADEDEDEDAQLAGIMLADGGKMSEARDAQDRQKENVLIAALTPAESERWVRFRRTMLSRATVRKLVNQTLSQSVPPSIVNVVNGYTKTFAGELVDAALEVQLEWLAAARERPERVPDDRGAPSTQNELFNVDEAIREKNLEGRAALGERIKLEKRGPLMPEHLREALRRYKRDSAGGAAGFMGFSGEGRENVAGRMGGRKLFR